MKEEIIVKLTFLILIIMTFFTIFKFSSQNGVESKSVSRKVARQIVEINPITRELSENDKEQIVENSQPFIRKMAHFTIYMIAGILIMGFFNTYDLSEKKKIIFTVILGLLYAISDEVHQGITGGGRTPRIFDVFIDTCGVLVGASIYMVICYFYNRKKV